jgi:hypothetical protein
MRLWAIVLGRARCDVRIASDSRPLRQRAKRRLRAGTGSHSTAGVDLGGPASALARLGVDDIATRLRAFTRIPVKFPELRGEPSSGKSARLIHTTLQQSL